MEVLPSQKVVYSELAARLSPALESCGMRRLKRVSYPAWRSDDSELGEVIFFSLQVDRRATDPFKGGGFRAELEKSRQRDPACGLTGRALFFQLLTAEELETLLAQQNRVIGSRPKPPAEQVSLYPEGPVRRMYLSYFEPQSAFDAVRCWLRYGRLADVREWADALAPIVRPLNERADAYLSPERLALGQGCLLEAT
jgi:hypothetical protein